MLVKNASNQEVGAMSANQEQARAQLKSLAFYHHALRQADRRYATTEKELLAVVLAIKKFRVYLGKPFNLITDHKVTQWLYSLSVADEKGRKGHWLKFLQQYEINPIHKAGKSDTVAMADYLSRVGADGHLVATLQAQTKEGC